MTKVEKVIQGDCLNVLKTLEDNSVDSVVTDPPYGLSKEPDINEVLSKWLVRLVTPPNGTVLDPFAGSGSTLVAAKREGFGFIGVELTEEYIPIIEARVGAEATGTKAEANEGQAKQ